MAKTPAPVFVREATGLVREISVTGSLFLNMASMNIALGALTYTSAPYIFPGGDPVLATVIATTLCLFPSLMYTLLTWAMPRSGGDYVFVGRILNPVLGFVVSFNIQFWYIIFMGIICNWVTTFAISPVILIIGSVSGNQALVGFANLIAQPMYTFLIGIIVAVSFTAVMIKGAKALVTANNIIFIVAIIGTIIMGLLLATHTNADFMNEFNRYASYNGIISAAHAAGYSPQGSNALYATLGITPFVFASTGYGILTSYWAGEVKSVKKNALVSQVGATILVGTALTILGALVIGVFGYDFLGSITMLQSTGSSQYPFSVPPYLNLFVSMLTTNQSLLWFLAIAYVAAVLGVVPGTFMSGTRAIFAWAFDRVVPVRLADVSDRFHTPIVATGIVAIITVFGLGLYTFGPPSVFSFVAGAGMAEIFSLIVVAVTAIVFPYVKKEMFENSPAKIKLAGIPLISIAGVISLLFYLLIENFYFTNSLYGANIPIVYEVIAGSIISPLVIFVASYYYHKGNGLDITLAFKQIPPE